METKAQRTGMEPGRQERSRVWTIGHSNLDIDRFVDRLKGHRAARLADIRRYPASQRNPQFNREMLEAVLGARGIRYRWFERLGGRRRGLPASVSRNRGLLEEGFRTYADYMGTQAFRRAVDDLVDWMVRGRTVLMCAEADWRRCHRRLLSDILLVRGFEVHHILSAEKAEAHAVWDLARETPEGLEYPPFQTELGLDP